MINFYEFKKIIKAEYDFFLVVIIALLGIGITLLLIFNPKEDENFIDKFIQQDLVISIIKTEVIFSDDIFIEYKLNDYLTYACNDYDCFMTIEIYDQLSLMYRPLGPVIHLTDSTYEGQIVIPIMLLKTFNYDKYEEKKVKLIVNIFSDKEAYEVESDEVIVK